MVEGLVPVTNSSYVSGFRYIPCTQTLVVHHTGKPVVFTYHGVPATVAQGLYNAPSKGTFLNQNVITKYEVTKQFVK